MWAIINKKDSFNIIHTHSNSYLSAEYYEKAPMNCGKFLVENPNGGSTHSFPKIIKKKNLIQILEVYRWKKVICYSFQVIYLTE